MGRIISKEVNWYRFHQNNSGGYCKPPAGNVYVEASSEAEANSIAEDHGVYFYDAGDCVACCGSRWNEQWYAPDEDDVPPDDCLWVESTEVEIPAAMKIDAEGKVMYADTL